MPVWNVCGGNRLNGSVAVQGSKNAVLPIMAASLIGGGVSRLTGCPHLRDVDASMEILRELGCGVMQNGGEIVIDSAGMCRNHIPHALMLKMRSSVMYMGAILARAGDVRISTPGGCELGSRPIDLHLKALRALGAEVTEQGGEVICRAARLRGAHINLDFPSVGATENVMLAACAAEGETVLTNAAREPEIQDLQAFLNAAGASVHGAGSAEIHICGFDARPYVTHRVMPDRIAAATYLCAAAAAGGEVELLHAVPAHLRTVCAALEEMGCTVQRGADHVRLRSGGALHAAHPVVTKPYPGFPTDAQALLMAASLRAAGTTVFIENIFENRYRHVDELRRMGADVRVEGRVAMVSGVERLHGAPVTACDLRGGAALVIAGLSAEGETAVCDSGHIERGYDGLADALRALGADVTRTEDAEEK
ncbi:MAG: UDP-N-acetylglucosamine 1-carboxyvinyltransferase [Oscillospiraceae bacterium]|nr:UDP-N-acetylglucosamine 1-carboxyvinyltransferase [Oscillospiraceae bacterium]